MDKKAMSFFLEVAKYGKYIDLFFIPQNLNEK